MTVKSLEVVYCFIVPRGRDYRDMEKTDKGGKKVDMTDPFLSKAPPRNLLFSSCI